MSYANTPFPGSLAARQAKLAERERAQHTARAREQSELARQKVEVHRTLPRNSSNFSAGGGAAGRSSVINQWLQRGDDEDEEDDEAAEVKPPVLERQHATFARRKRISVPATPAQIESITRKRAVEQKPTFDASVATEFTDLFAASGTAPVSPATLPPSKPPAQSACRRVVLELPTEDGVLGFSPKVVQVYREMCMDDAVARNEAPMDLGLVFTPERLGSAYSACVEQWSSMADAAVVYTDIGLTAHMSLAISGYTGVTPVEFRTLGSIWHTKYKTLLETKVEPVPPPLETKVEPVPPPLETKVEPVPPPLETKVEPVPPPLETKVESVPPPLETKVEPVPPPLETKARTRKRSKEQNSDEISITN